MSESPRLEAILSRNEKKSVHRETKHKERRKRKRKCGDVDLRILIKSAINENKQAQLLDNQKKESTLRQLLQDRCDSLASFCNERLFIGVRCPQDDELFYQWACEFREFGHWLKRIGLEDRLKRIKLKPKLAKVNAIAWVRAAGEYGQLEDLACCLQEAAQHPGLLVDILWHLRRLPTDLLPNNFPKPHKKSKCDSLPDGPFDPFSLRVYGERYSGFARLEWKLLKLLWGSESVPNPNPEPIWKVVEFVYVHDTTKNLNALHSTKNRLNQRLLKQGCPLEVHEKNEAYYLELTSN